MLLKRFIIILMLCLMPVHAVQSGTAYNNAGYLRALPFIQMMIVMMDFMDKFMGGNKHYYPGMNYWGSNPYAMMPGSTLSNYAGYPMSPFNSGQNLLNNNNFLTHGLKPQSSSKNTNTNNSQAADSDYDNDNDISQDTDYSLNGIWQAMSGDVLAIYNNNRFIWSDGNNRHLAGQIIIRGNLFYAYIPAKNTTLKFEFYWEANQFVVRDQSARIYTFKRIH